MESLTIFFITVNSVLLTPLEPPCSLEATQMILKVPDIVDRDGGISRALLRGCSNC